MAASLSKGIVNGLKEHDLPFAEVHQFSTPRRLAVWVQSVGIKAPDTENNVVGPPLSAARDEKGQWTKAAEGFAKKQGLLPDDLSVVEEQGVERIAAHVSVNGAKAADVMPSIIASAVSGIPVSKRMRWGRSRDEFLRPVQWLVLLLGDDIVPLELFGLSSGRDSRGHRFHDNQPRPIASPGVYRDVLRDARVLVDAEERRTCIAEQVSALAKQGEVVALADDLLDEVTGLVEWPTALRGSFDPDFLEVPAQALISAMKTHQKYFHLNDAKSGALLPAFITVSNIDSREPDAVVTGNERVIRPRLSDAAFFLQTTKSLPWSPDKNGWPAWCFSINSAACWTKLSGFPPLRLSWQAPLTPTAWSLNARRNSVNATWSQRWCWNFRSYRELQAHTMRSTTAKWQPLPKPSKSTTTPALRVIACPPPLRRPRSRSQIASTRWWVFSVSESRPRGQRIRLPCAALHLQ